MPYDVFISYSSVDKPVADAACAMLEAQNLRCWIAPRDIAPGSDWSEAIIDGLNQCRVMVLLLSAHANLSPQVRREAERAVHKGLVIVPFRIENVELSKSMEYFISSTHWMDALTPPVEQHLTTLANYLKRLLPDREKEQAVATPQASSDSLEAPPEVPRDKKDTLSWGKEDSTPCSLQCDEVTIKNIESALATYMGPLAKLLVKQDVQKAANTHDLYLRLAKHIPHDKERQLFLEKCKAAEEACARPASQATTAPRVSWDEATLLRAEKRLAHYMGPLAKLLVKRTAGRAKSVDELYQFLAENIPTQKEKDEFLKVSLG